MQLLQANSPALTKISTDFRNQVSGIKIVSFKEQKLTPPFDKLVIISNVRLTSARLANQDS